MRVRNQYPTDRVSTHSRLKAADDDGGFISSMDKIVSTHSRLKAAEHLRPIRRRSGIVSTHSRLKAAEDLRQYLHTPMSVSTHSRLKAADRTGMLDWAAQQVFQHTAA